MPKSFLNNHKMRGLRNNNPGNLVKTKINWQGKLPRSQNKDKRFEQFENLHFGIRAQLMDLVNDIKKGKNTIEKLIHEYAPAFENNTKAYIDSVAKTVNIKPTDKITAINHAFLLALSRAIYIVELGEFHKEISDADISAGINSLPKLSSSTLAVDVKKKIT